MNKKIYIICTITALLFILYLICSYYGFLFFTNYYNGIDYIVFNVIGDALLVGITTYMATKSISIYISKKEFNISQRINIHINEKNHSLYNFEYFLENHNEENVYWGINSEDRDIIEYVYKKYNLIKVLLNYNNLGDNLYIENILNYPFVGHLLDNKKNFIKEWKREIDLLNIGENKSNIKLFRSVMKDEDYKIFERFSCIIKNMKYYEIINLNNNSGCVVLITADKQVIDKVNCLPNSRNKIYFYFDSDKSIEYIAFTHDYDGKETANLLGGFRYTNEKEEIKPANINLNDFMEVK